MASRMQLRRGGESPGQGADDAERTVVVGSASTVQSRVARSRTVTTPAGSAADHVVALALTTSRRWRWPERVPWAGRACRIQRTRQPPYDARGRDSLNQARATGADLTRSQFGFDQFGFDDVPKQGSNHAEIAKIMVAYWLQFADHPLDPPVNGSIRWLGGITV